MTQFSERMDVYRAAVEAELAARFTENLPQKRLFDAMRYSLLAGGKRIRPVLTLEFCRLCGGDWHEALPFACAVEMVHTYSLIHDDLPCMDNDDYRRGRLTNHKIFGEAVAVLAGDGLLTAAFETLCQARFDAQKIVSAVQTLSGCAGELGMVGGQILDMQAESQELSEEGIHTIHELKTAALIRAACLLGAIAGGADEAQLQAAEAYARALGLAFQIRDDMLDVLGDEKKLGKATHVDAQKNTFVRLYGVGACAGMIEAETKKAVAALACFEDAGFLAEMAKRLALRDY